jgi:hypothetical protein
MNSYQKLKKRNKDLEKEYDDLLEKVGEYIKNPDSPENQSFKTWIWNTIILRLRFPKFYITSLIDKLGENKDSGTYSWNTVDKNAQ